MITLSDCDDLVLKYIEYLSAAFTIGDSSESECRIETPFMRPDGDHFDLFVINQADGSILFTDYGQTFDWFFSVGLDIEGNENRERIVEYLAKAYGVEFTKKALRIRANSDTVGIAMHNILMAIQSVSQMTILRRPYGQATFKDEVEIYLVQQQQEFRPNFTVRGRSIEHKIDFYLDSGRNMLVEALSASSPGLGLSLVKQTAFKFIDINAIDSSYTKVALIDDSRDRWDTIWSTNKVQNTLANYTDRVIRWSQKTQLLAPLAKG